MSTIWDSLSVELHGARLRNTCGIRRCVRPDHWEREKQIVVQAVDAHVVSQS